MSKRLQHLTKFAVMAIATLAISLNINAQEWYILGEYTFSAPHPVGTFHEHHIQGEDVIIAGLEYHTIYVDSEDYGNYLDGAFRNDENQVYYCKWNGDSYDDEVLLYDYDLEVGDFFLDDSDHPMEVTEVMTITDNIGVARKQITFSFLGLTDVTEVWVEGIGSNRGFMHVGMWEAAHDSDGQVFHLLCYHIDNSVIYINPEYNTCDIDEVIENSIDNVSIYPNPANEIVKILNDNNLNITSVEIIDLTGRTVMTAGKTDDIDISGLSEGQYFVKIIGEKTIVKKLFITK